MVALIAQESQRIGHPILGIIIPAFILGVSFVIAFGLYRHFTKKGV
jgi:hypothetical protein